MTTTTEAPPITDGNQLPLGWYRLTTHQDLDNLPGVRESYAFNTHDGTSSPWMVVQPESVVGHRWGALRDWSREGWRKDPPLDLENLRGVWMDSVHVASATPYVKRPERTAQIYMWPGAVYVADVTEGVRPGVVGDGPLSEVLVYSPAQVNSGMVLLTPGTTDDYGWTLEHRLDGVVDRAAIDNYGATHRGFFLYEATVTVLRPQADPIEIGRLRSQADDFHLEAEQAREQLADFRSQIRDAVIEYGQSNGLCRPGINEWLERQGLDGMETDFEVSVRFYIDRTITITATSEQAVRDGFSLDAAEVRGESAVELHNADDYEIQDIEDPDE